MWTVIMHFENDTVYHYNLSKTAAKKLVETAVFNNEDCLNCRIVKQDNMVLQLPKKLEKEIVAFIQASCVLMGDSES